MADTGTVRTGPDFRSDNTGAAHPKVLEALIAANRDTATSYGLDDWSKRVQERFAELFERRVRVWPVATGTSANALALAASAPSHGAIYCADIAHVHTSETNAAGFFSGGARLMLMPATHGRFSAETLEQTIAAAGVGLSHRSQPATVTLTQATDLGVVWTPDEVRAVSAVAKRHKLTVHMDGARLANALARLGCTPAEITWKAGVDILSFGMTKNGGMLCDAIVVFDEAVAPALNFHLRRAGQIWSKGRFASAQLLAYVEDGLWLELARRSNALAARIDAGLRGAPGVRLAAPVEINEVFVNAAPELLDALERDGIRYSRRARDYARFVTRCDGTEAEIAQLLAAFARHAAHA